MTVSDAVRELLTVEREQLAAELFIDQTALDALNVQAAEISQTIATTTQTIADIDATLEEV